MTDDTGREVYALLEEARKYGVGVSFDPDFDDEGNEAGWTINYVIYDWPGSHSQSGFPGDRLASAYELDTAVAAALKPLRDIGEAYLRLQASR